MFAKNVIFNTVSFECKVTHKDSGTLWKCPFKITKLKQFVFTESNKYDTTVFNVPNQNANTWYLNL